MTTDKSAFWLIKIGSTVVQGGRNLSDRLWHTGSSQNIRTWELSYFEFRFNSSTILSQDTLEKNPYVCRIEFFPPKTNVIFQLNCICPNQHIVSITWIQSTKHWIILNFEGPSFPFNLRIAQKTFHIIAAPFITLLLTPIEQELVEYWLQNWSSKFLQKSIFGPFSSPWIHQNRNS